MSSEYSIAYLSEGNLFISRNGRPFKPVESAFADDMKSRLQSIQKKHEWKTTGEGARFMGVQPALGGADPAMMSVKFTGLSHCGKNSLRYSMQTDSVGGLFDYDLTDDSELRLIHKEYFSVSDIDVHPQTEETVCTIAADSGISNIAIISRNDIAQITEGDSFDESPRWIPGTRGGIVFHSAGIARNGEGYFAGTGHFCILKLDLEKGTLETVIENPVFDYLSPQYNEDGDLFCIRRKYQGAYSGNSIVSAFKDMILFPLRIIRAVLHYLNVFSMIYSKQPLMTAGGNGKKGPDRKSVFLYGRMIEAEKEMKKAGKNSDGRIIPADWELTKITQGGETEVLARGVSAFDICGDTVVYTNGTAIFRIEKDGSKSSIAQGSFIQKLRCFNME